MVNSGDALYALYDGIRQLITAFGKELVEEFQERIWSEDPPEDYDGNDSYIVLSQEGGQSIHAMQELVPAEQVALTISIWMPVARGLAAGLRARGTLWALFDSVGNVKLSCQGFGPEAQLVRIGWSNDRDGDWREYATKFMVVLNPA